MSKILNKLSKTLIVPKVEEIYIDIKPISLPFNSIKHHFDEHHKRKKMFQSEEIISSVISFIDSPTPKQLIEYSLVSKGWEKVCSKDTYWKDYGSKQSYFKKKKNVKKILVIDNPQDYHPFPIESLTYKEDLK